MKKQVCFRSMTCQEFRLGGLLLWIITFAVPTAFQFSLVKAQKMDPVEWAVRWWELSELKIEELHKVAEQGEAFAQTFLGNKYAEGRGVPENDREAVKWYRKAAEQGWPGAQCDLGIMYEKGEGVPEDYVRAYAWANLAAAQGHRGAVALKDRLRSIMPSKQVMEAQKLARNLFKRIESGKLE